MSSKYYHIVKSFLLGWLLLTGLFIYGQSAVSVELGVADHVQLEAGLNSIDLQLYNSSMETFIGRIDFVLPQGLGTLGTTQIPVNIPAGKKRFFSQRLQGKALSRLKGQQLKIELRSATGTLLQTKLVTIDVPLKRGVILQDLTAQQYLRQVGDSIFIKARAINTGTTDEQLKLLYSSPDRIGNTKFQEQSLNLSAGKDTVLMLRFVVEKYMLKRAQYTVAITGLYENGDVFGNLSILLSNMAADRNYQQLFDNRGNLAAYSRNFIDIQMDNLLGEQQSYYLQSEGEYRLGSGQLRYSAYLTKTGGVEQPTLSNTFASFQRGRNIYTLGHIQESMEAPVYGRGLKFDHVDTSRAANFAVGILQHRVDLLDYSALNEAGVTVFGKLVLGENKPERYRYEGQLFYSRNTVDSTTGLLWSNSFDLFKQKDAGKMVMRGFVGAGLESRNMMVASGDSSMPSLALGLRVDRRLAKWNFSADNFYSSPYYTGNRRGALQLAERVSRQWGKLSTNLSYTFYRYNPSYLNERFLNYASQSSRWDLSMYRPLTPFLTLSMVPNYNKEKGTYALTDGIRDLAFESWRILSTLNIRSRNMQHNVNMITETGLVSGLLQGNGNLILRSDINYNYRSLNLSASYQEGVFQLADLVSAMVLGRPLGSRFSVGARVGGQFLQNRLQWSANARVNKSHSYGNSYGGNASFNYRVFKNTMVTGLFQYNYSAVKAGYNYDFNNLRIGIRQNLNGSNINRPAVKTGDLRVFCFYDHNFNGVFDGDDQPASGHSFTIKGILFVSDQSGHASFKKLPYGSYLLFSPKQGQYMALSKELIVQQGNMQIQVPLQRGGTVKGKINIEYTPGLSLETDLNLDIHSIVAKDANGTTVSIRVDKDGRFEAGLPLGRYSFYLDATKFPEHVFSDAEAQTATIEIADELVLEPFVLKVKSKKVNVKRFGQ